MKFAVIYGSVRMGRQGIKLARFMASKLKERGHEVTLVDPVEYKLPLLENRYSDYVKAGKVPDVVEQVSQIFSVADGFVIVTGEYNHSPPPALTNILDHFKDQYARKIGGIASYSSGQFGGVRAAIMLRPLLGEIGLVSMPRIFAVPMIQNAFDDSGKALDSSYDDKAKGYLDDLEWYAKALKDARSHS